MKSLHSLAAGKPEGSLHRVGHSGDSLTVRRGMNYGTNPGFVSKKMNKNYEKEEQARLKAKIKKTLTKEDVPYKDASYTMRRGGWVVKRNGKVASIVLPTEDHAKRFIDSTKMTLGRKVGDVIRRKAKEIARGMGRMSLATESAANRRRVRSWDSAIMPELKPLRVKPKSKVPFDADPPKKNPGIVVGKNDPGYSRARHLARQGLKKAMERERINKTIDYISNPRYSVLDKNTINKTLKGN